MVEADAGKFGKGDGENGEIDPGDAEAEGESADDRAARRGNRYRGEKPDPRSDAEAREQHCGDVSAEPGENRVAERQLAGEAHHDIPGLAGIGEIKNEDENGDEIVVGNPRRDHERRQESGQQDRGPARHAIGEARHHQAGLLPRMPCGRNSNTATRMAKANMLLADGVNSNPASASVKPISRPPTSAPAIEPRPPVMTMTKANSV